MSAPLYRTARSFLFRFDPERAHELAIGSAKRAEQVVEAALVQGLPLPEPPTSERLAQRILGIDFPNPIGLAAGFDKDGVAPHLWPLLGFGFAELGTVTAERQPGNPRPRMFRLAADRGVVNRLGFNGKGSEEFAENLERSLRIRRRAPIGVNVGCSRSRVGDPERELADYRTTVRRAAHLADYIAVNVSSPNTPGLRDLQEPRRLARLIRALREELDQRQSARKVPLLVKLSPDLDDSQVGEVCDAARGAGAAGFVATNTTITRPGCLSPQSREVGGLSGAPLRSRSNAVIARVRAAIGKEMPIIGVGGVMSLPDVLEKLEAGANLVALYTGLIYEGPLLARRLALSLDRELRQRGRTLLDFRCEGAEVGDGVGETLTSVSVK